MQMNNWPQGKEGRENIFNSTRKHASKQKHRWELTIRAANVLSIHKYLRDSGSAYYI